MFGQLKESILSNLEKNYKDNNETTFKESFKEYVKTLKENKTLKEFNEVYELLNDMRFDNESIAKEFVEESITYLKTLDLKAVDKLSPLVENKLNLENHIYNSIDQLVFNDKISLIDKVNHKSNLVKHLMRNEKQLENEIKKIGKIGESLSSKIALLNEEQVKVVNMFAENDESKINDYYTNLIEGTTNKIDSMVNESDDIMVVKKLLEVRGRLIQMKNDKPTIKIIEDIIDLNQSFE